MTRAILRLDMRKKSISNSLVDWYERNKRELPWRDQHDPYIIWLSEVILQQTRVSQGLPYFLLFTSKFPTVKDLANAHIDEVLRAWQGLGYYSRARNMHKCAQVIVSEHGGQFPSEKHQLIKLPGIGPYTAAAIASLAFGKQEAVVDGNVIRVICRLYGISKDIGDPKVIKQIQKIVDDIIPKSRPDLFNQAIMEFGAMHCTPKNPLCDGCMFEISCIAHQQDKVGSIPFKAVKTKKRDRFFVYLIISIHGKYLLQKRNTKDIWQGLFEFYLIESDTEIGFDELAIPNVLRENPGFFTIIEESNTFKHLLTHQVIRCKFVEIKMSQTYIYLPTDWPGYQLFSPEEIYDLPKSILIDRYWSKK